MATHLDDHGVVRQDHYGSGHQPWDDIVELNWAPEFAAGNVLKYLRRSKAIEHSLESARWYWRELLKMVDDRSIPGSDRAARILKQLLEVLTAEEAVILK